MRVIESISEDEMIAVFLKGELNSPRFGAEIFKMLVRQKINRSIIDHPDTTIEGDNLTRREILDSYRGYAVKEGDLFKNFPSSTPWVRAALNREDLSRVRYINYSYWNELSSGTRRPMDAAPNIRNGIKVFKISSQPFLDAAQTFKQAPHFPEMIFVGTSLDDLIILEGHFRMTVYFLEPDLIPAELTAIVGISPDLQRWSLY